MNRHTEERNGQGSSSSNDNRKRRRNEDAPSGGMVDQNGAGGSKNRHHGGRGRGRGTRNHDNGGTGGRGNRGGGGGGRDGNQSKRGGSSGRHNQNRRHNTGGRGRANGHRDHDHGNKRPNSSASAASTLKSNSNYSFNGEDASTAATTTTTTHVVSRSSSTLSSQGDDITALPSLATATANASLFTTISNSSNNSNNTQQQQATIRDNKTTTTTTLLSWPNPHSHYIPITQEEHLLPALIHWGQSERGMMKDQPPFRLQKLQNVLDSNNRNNANASTTAGNNGNNNNNNNNNNGKKKNNNSNQSHTSSSSSTTTTQSISLLQSLSLRRHHLKLLNPKYPMSALRLGNEQDIRNAAQLFEMAVDAYLKRQHNVQYLTEEEQRAQYEEKVRGIMPTRKDRKEMKQPPTPDFIMRDGHCVRLVLYTAGDVDDCDANANAKCNKEGVHGSSDHALTQTQHKQQQQHQHPTSINWIEAKMFYGASTIPPNTPNAVGCILPKMKTYVSLYGTGAIVFMYGCGSQLARDLLDVGVIALDARHLDLSAVEKQQRGWCADGWGSILF